MSIYATLIEFGFKRFGDKNFIPIFAQDMPPHITNPKSFTGQYLKPKLASTRLAEAI